MDILFAGIGNRFYFDTGQFIMKIYDSHNCFFSKNIDKIRFKLEFCSTLYSDCRTQHDVITDLECNSSCKPRLKGIIIIGFTTLK